MPGHLEFFKCLTTKDGLDLAPDPPFCVRIFLFLEPHSSGAGGIKCLNVKYTLDKISPIYSIFRYKEQHLAFLTFPDKKKTLLTRRGVHFFELKFE